MRAERDAGRALERLVDGGVAIVARAAPVYEVIRRASADPDVTELLEENRRERYLRQRDLVGILADAGHLTVDLDTAADAYYALVNEELFALLVGHRGWAIQRYRQWVLVMLTPQLRGRNVA